jgi:hypothetical protein
MTLSELLLGLKEFLLGHLLKAILSSFASVLTASMAYQYKLLFAIDKQRRRMENSEFQIKLHIVYNSNVDFIVFCKELKDCFRDKYKHLQIFKENSYILQFEAGDLFNIDVHNIDNQITFDTSKLTLQTKNVKQKTNQLLNCMDDIQENVKKICSNPTFGVSDFSLNLYLPVNNSFSKVYTPDVLNIENYKIKAVHSESNNLIEIQAQQIYITTPYRHRLDKIIEFFI